MKIFVVLSLHAISLKNEGVVWQVLVHIVHIGSTEISGVHKSRIFGMKRMSVAHWLLIYRKGL